MTLNAGYRQVQRLVSGLSILIHSISRTEIGVIVWLKGTMWTESGLLAPYLTMVSGWLGVRMSKHQITDNVKTERTGPLSVTVEDLPTFGLVCTSQHSDKIHRVAMSVGRESQYSEGELRPPCDQAPVSRGEAINGKEYSQEWRQVRIDVRLPFARFDLCQSPNCFAGVELEGGADVD